MTKREYIDRTINIVQTGSPTGGTYYYVKLTTSSNSIFNSNTVGYSTKGSARIEKPNEENINRGNKYENKLCQTYPNPVIHTSEVTINFETKEQNIVDLKLYDILGVEIVAISNRVYSPGKHSVVLEINKLNLPPGIYFYRIITGKFTDVKKMVVIK